MEERTLGSGRGVSCWGNERRLAAPTKRGQIEATHLLVRMRVCWRAEGDGQFRNCENGEWGCWTERPFVRGYSCDCRILDEESAGISGVHGNRSRAVGWGSGDYR